MLTAKFKALQTKLDKLPHMRFVSISVDPEHDTPAVLKAYAQRFDADPALAVPDGPSGHHREDGGRGLQDAHRRARAPNAHDPTLVDIMHGEHFVLVDGGWHDPWVLSERSGGD